MAAWLCSWRASNHASAGARPQPFQPSRYNGYLPEIKNQSIDRAMNGSGIRDTARVLEISPTTVINELKKRILP